MRSSCGGCGLCCYFAAVPEYDSPRDHWCKYYKKGEGCSIHSVKHNVCRAFGCLWFNQTQIPGHLRPDICGVAFELPSYAKTYIGYTEPGRPEAFRSPDVQTLIKKITAIGHAVMIYRGPGTSKIFYVPKNVTEKQVRRDLFQAHMKHIRDGRPA